MTIICKGITSKNKNCKKKTAHESGFCNVHRDQEKKEEKKELKKDIGWDILYKKFNTQKAPIIRQQKEVQKKYDKIYTDVDLIQMVIADTQTLMYNNPNERNNLQIALISFKTSETRLIQEETKLQNQLIDIQKSLVGITKFINYYNNKHKIKKCNKKIEQTECVICLSEIEKDKKEENVSLYCGHTFHVDCIYGWFQKDILTCPTCRNELR